LAAAAALVAADGTIDAQETDFLAMVEELLGRA
jgi:tellurite resistance protein